MSEPSIEWDLGTAYDFFISKAAITNPSDFGLRPAWAAGVRSRLPDIERETLEREILFLEIPFHWIHTLPEPKDGLALLEAFEEVAPQDRLDVLSFMTGTGERFRELLLQVRDQGEWSEGEEGDLLQLCKDKGMKNHKGRTLGELIQNALDAWARAEEYGELLLRAYRTYFEAFFAEEENRIRPALEQALEAAQKIAEGQTLKDLLEQLSQGVRLDEDFDSEIMVLTPSFWGAPLLIFGHSTDEIAYIAFGGRPPDASLVPGEAVPEDLLRALKALSDPTRLRILRYLSEESLTPSQLARRLRLRAPTVVHHLNTLRLATLVQLTIGPGKKDKRYAAREDRIAAASQELHNFLGHGLTLEPEQAPMVEEVDGG